MSSVGIDEEQLTEDRWEALAKAAAARRSGAVEEQSALLELLTLQLAGTPYAIPVVRVREIVRMRSVTPVPRVPSEILGVISLRGEIVQVVDMRRRLGLAVSEPSRDSRIIIVLTEDNRLAGLLVDAVTSVLRIKESVMLPAPAGETENIAGLCPRGKEFVSLIALDRVLEIGTEH